MMNSAVLAVVLVLMIVAAVVTVVTDRLLTAVIFAGALSTFAALGYLLLGAPDVALAEIVVGATLATVIFLVTLKKYRIVSIYLIGGKSEAAQRVYDVAARALLAHELQPHLLHAQEEASVLLARPGCDLVIEPGEGATVLHGEESSEYVGYILAELRAAGLPVTLQDSLMESAEDYKEGRI